MNALFTWLSGLGSAISGALDFLLGLVLDLVYVVRLLGRFLTLVSVFFSWLPPQLLTIIIAAVSIAVIFKLIGR